MRVVTGPDFVAEMKKRRDPTPDCFVRPGEYQHHLYIDGYKYVVAEALMDCLKRAEERSDKEALLHLRLHKEQLDKLTANVELDPNKNSVFGRPKPNKEEEDEKPRNSAVPPEPKEFKDLGISMTFFVELVLRTIYNRGRMAASDIAQDMHVPFGLLNEILPRIRQQGLIDMVSQQQGAIGDAGCEYEIKPPKGTNALEDALKKTEYVGPLPVPFDQYKKMVAAQTIKGVEVTRNNIECAFEDLVITPEVFNEIGPAINSAASIFLFGFPGNGKTSIAERITRLMGDDIYIPYAVEANGQIIKVFDKILHEPVEEDDEDGVSSLLRGSLFDERYIKIKRPTIVVGGELVLPMLDLKYNDVGKFYEAPLQMKANGGMFMIDDFGRQQVRPMDLLNRWIVPLEKKYDYLTTVNGMKLEVPFDELLVFSTNLDPTQLADEAFLRRIKFKIEVRDPDQRQWRRIWRIMCKVRKVEYDEKGISYLVEKHFKPKNRPFRMCQPRDILDQMISIAKYNMEDVTFTPDLVDAAAATYFVDNEGRDFGAAVRLD